MAGVPMASLLPDLFFKLVSSVFFPDPVDVVLSLQMEEPDYNFRLHVRNKEFR